MLLITEDKAEAVQAEAVQASSAGEVRLAEDQLALGAC